MRRRIHALFGVAILAAVMAIGQPAAMADSARPEKAAAVDYYHVLVRTGDVHPGAGTEAGVWLFLRGQKDTFRVRMRTDGNFAFNRVARFTYLLPDLGSLQEICVWRNDEGPDPMWYLDYVDVWTGSVGPALVRVGTGSFYQWIPAQRWVCKKAT